MAPFFIFDQTCHDTFGQPIPRDLTICRLKNVLPIPIGMAQFGCVSGFDPPYPKGLPRSTSVSDFVLSKLNRLVENGTVSGFDLSYPKGLAQFGCVSGSVSS